MIANSTGGRKYIKQNNKSLSYIVPVLFIYYNKGNIFCY